VEAFLGLNIVVWAYRVLSHKKIHLDMKIINCSLVICTSAYCG